MFTTPFPPRMPPYLPALFYPLLRSCATNFGPPATRALSSRSVSSKSLDQWVSPYVSVPLALSSGGGARALACFLSRHLLTSKRKAAHFTNCTQPSLRASKRCLQNRVLQVLVCGKAISTVVDYYCRPHISLRCRRNPTYFERGIGHRREPVIRAVDNV